MVKKAFLGVRLKPELKKQLEDIAAAEERSVSQISEILLRKGVEGYENEGPKYLQRFLSQRRPKAKDQ